MHLHYNLKHILILLAMSFLLAIITGIFVSIYAFSSILFAFPTIISAIGKAGIEEFSRAFIVNSVFNQLAASALVVTIIVSFCYAMIEGVYWYTNLINQYTPYKSIISLNDYILRAVDGNGIYYFLFILSFPLRWVIHFCLFSISFLGMRAKKYHILIFGIISHCLISIPLSGALDLKKYSIIMLVASIYCVFALFITQLLLKDKAEWRKIPTYEPEQR